MPPKTLFKSLTTHIIKFFRNKPPPPSKRSRGVNRKGKQKYVEPSDQAVDPTPSGTTGSWQRRFLPKGRTDDRAPVVRREDRPLSRLDVERIVSHGVIGDGGGAFAGDGRRSAGFEGGNREGGGLGGAIFDGGVYGGGYFDGRYVDGGYVDSGFFDRGFFDSAFFNTGYFDSEYFDTGYFDSEYYDSRKLQSDASPSNLLIKLRTNIAR
ncbi:hypothetical protein EG328_008854 [Venturia inaequalis]|uniref:Uncharacterized protein n=1 Tax=Venturia inaequalis TaxID=5025 RepID=A0A8H3Z5Y2_VENIN|nr:hypothetical protein EG328_008854 [Venturia inaequalis]